MITGGPANPTAPPISAPAPADERAQKVSNGEDDPYEPIAGRFPDHDPRLLALIDRALSRPLKDRPADAAAWFSAIHR